MRVPEDTSAILLLALEGDHAGGTFAFQQLARPLAEDRRWYGVCLMGQGQLFEAKMALAGAIAAGSQAAGIELAALYRTTNDHDLACGALQQVRVQDLSTFDRVQYLREAAGQAHMTGAHQLATQQLEEAWIAGQGSWAGTRQLVPVAQALASMYTVFGHDVKAVRYFEYALEHAQGGRRALVNGAWGLSLVYQGRFLEAETVIRKSLAAPGLTPVARANLIYAKGVLARARGALIQADAAFGEAAEYAQRMAFGEVECYAELGRCAVQTVLGDMNAARAHLSRASALATNAKTQLCARLRQGALTSRQGRDDAIDLIKGAAEEFLALGMLREAGWAWLHAAEHALARQDSTTGQEWLNRAVDYRNAVGNGHLLTVELRSLPHCAAALQGLPEGSYAKPMFGDLRQEEGAVPSEARLVTLGNTCLLVEGQRARLDLSRSIEILAYLLMNPNSRLEQVQVSLFPEVEHRRSKSYFHQARAELEHAVPGLSIPYDRASHTYQVVMDQLELQWDLADLKHALNNSQDSDFLDTLSRYSGVFLPQLDGEWIQRERDSLHSWIIKLGLQTLDGWFQAGEYHKCLSLAQRLIDLDPLDESLNEFLVIASLEVEGRIAARSVYKEVCHRFEMEIGETPPAVLQLAARFAHGP